MTGPVSGTGNALARQTRPPSQVGDRLRHLKDAVMRASRKPQSRYGILQKLFSIRGNRTVFANHFWRHPRVRIGVLFRRASFVMPFPLFHYPFTNSRRIFRHNGGIFAGTQWSAVPGRVAGIARSRRPNKQNIVFRPAISPPETSSCSTASQKTARYSPSQSGRWKSFVRHWPVDG